MTIDGKLLRGCLIALLLAFWAGCATDAAGKRGGLSEARVAALPPNILEPYRVFEHKCSRCHTLARPLSASIYELSHWKAYVARMRHHAGSGISESDGEIILQFLAYYAAEKKRADVGDEPEPPPENQPAAAVDAGAVQ